MIHVLTPASRPQNWPHIMERLRPQGVTWHPIVALGVGVSDEPWIVTHHVPELWPHGFDPCYWKLNRVIKEPWLKDDDWFHFLCDDGLVPANLYADVATVMTSQAVVVNAIRGREHTLCAAPSNMVKGRVTLEQIFVRGDVLKQFTFTNSPFADGMLAEWLVNFDVRYEPRLSVWFNALEPGRYIRLPQ